VSFSLGGDYYVVGKRERGGRARINRIKERKKSSSRFCRKGARRGNRGGGLRRLRRDAQEDRHNAWSPLGQRKVGSEKKKGGDRKPDLVGVVVGEEEKV